MSSGQVYHAAEQRNIYSQLIQKFFFIYFPWNEHFKILILSQRSIFHNVKKNTFQYFLLKIINISFLKCLSETFPFLSF